MRKPRIFCVLVLIYLCVSTPAMAADGLTTPGLWSQLVDLWQQVVATLVASEDDKAANSPASNNPGGNSGGGNPGGSGAEFAPLIVPNG